MAHESRRFTTPATASRDTGEEDRSRALMQVRLDGKAVRGATDADGNQVRLLAALVGPDRRDELVASRTQAACRLHRLLVKVTPGGLRRGHCCVGRSRAGGRLVL